MIGKVYVAKKEQEVITEKVIVLQFVKIKVTNMLNKIYKKWAQ